MLNEIDLSRADLNLLVLFDVVRREGHVGRAAEKLNLSPSAVSHGLGRLRRLLRDPVFLRTPKGVVPTARAAELAEPIAEVLAGARRVIASAEPFDAAVSARRFTIAAPDGASAVFLPSLLSDLRKLAPNIDIGMQQLLPPRGVMGTERAWGLALGLLESRAIDIAIAPMDDVPARFVCRTLHEEEFVIAMRAGHAFGDAPTLDAYCRMQHLVVSFTGEPYGFVDAVLAQHGRSRRIAFTVPNFMLALALLADTDFIAALPRSFVEAHAGRFDVISVDPPLPLPTFRIRALTLKVALMDAGVAWLFDRLTTKAPAADSAPRHRPQSSRGRSRGGIRKHGREVRGTE